MKKILALTLSSLLVLGGAGATVAVSAATDPVTPQSQAAEAEQNNLYLVPGTYVSGGTKVENTVPSGATKLTEDECKAIFTENVYLCNLSKGATLPIPASTRVDKAGKKFVFNGWWTIVDATVTYFKTVPNLTETTYLYADWRAEISQPKDPIIPEEGVVVEPDHYMVITHASGDSEKVTLRKSYTDQMNAETLGYLYPVELYTQGLQLSPGDKIEVYTTGLTKSEKPVITPVIEDEEGCEINLESAGDGSNRTADYLDKYEPASFRKPPYLTYIAEDAGSYNIYIKYYFGGNTMAVYLEPAL